MAGGCVNIVDGNGWGFAVNGTSEVFPKTYVICFAKFCQALPPEIGDEKGAHVDSLQQLELCEAALKAIQLWQWCGSTCLG